MGEQVDMSEMNINTSVVTFDNFTILKEFGNIPNLLSNEDFCKTVPKIRGVKWVQMFSCVKQDILNEMVQEISSMWEFENMPKKLEILDSLKEKYAEINPTSVVWRPQQNDVKGQLKAYDIAILKKQRKAFQSLVQENEAKTNRLRKTVAAKRVYLKTLHMDIHKYQKKSEEIILKIHEAFANHNHNLTEYTQRFNVNDIKVDE